MLLEIEDFARNTATEMGLDISRDRFLVQSWTLDEVVGVSELSTIRDYQGQYLDNTTKSVRFHFRCGRSDEKGCDFTVTVVENQPGWSEIQVEIWGVAGERDKATGAAAALEGRFRRSANNNYIFFFSWLLAALLLLLWFLLGLLLVKGGGEDFVLRIYLPGIGILGLILLYTFLGYRYLPWPQLQTRRTEMRARRFWKLSWFFAALFLTSVVSILIVFLSSSQIP